jgi:hypothetical protein
MGKQKHDSGRKKLNKRREDRKAAAIARGPRPKPGGRGKRY